MIYENRLSAENFMPIGHYWWAILFGYIGGQLASYNYIRQTTEPPAGT